jgi:putative transposase
MVRGEWRPVPWQPKGNLTAGIDPGINNLLVIYVENGLTKLINGKPLKPVSYYWRKKIAEYQSMLTGMAWRRLGGLGECTRSGGGR